MSDRQEIAHDLAHDLAQAENALDAAFAAVGGLVARLPAYRLEAGLSAVAGQGVFSAFSQAVATLGTARGELVQGHNKLEALRRGMKLQPMTAIGAADKPASLTIESLELADA
jgi:hypothetical protein